MQSVFIKRAINKSSHGCIDVPFGGKPIPFLSYYSSFPFFMFLMAVLLCFILPYTNVSIGPSTVFFLSIYNLILRDTVRCSGQMHDFYRLPLLSQITKTFSIEMHEHNQKIQQDPTHTHTHLPHNQSFGRKQCNDTNGASASFTSTFDVTPGSFRNRGRTRR